MAINSSTTIYGSTPSNPEKFDLKSKSTKTYGVLFPLGSNTYGGYFKKCSGLELVRGNLRQLLLTERGERFMLPSYGTNLKRYISENIDETLFNLIRKEILETLNKYAKNVEIIKLQLLTPRNVDVAGGGVISIRLFCRIKEEEETIFDIKVEI